ncbi:uncharacterized protein C8R40DRAFT_1043178, partial [Lentinula edodes]|uniref:uncharacterized protein n=1 Tax=Lentinula edodes TaxID=5353 RepID=UPI001E8EF346
IQQLTKEFQVIDHEKDGCRNESDLRDIFRNLEGITPTQTIIDDLLSFRPRDTFCVSSVDKRINFARFLTLMNETLFEFDTETELPITFANFHENDNVTVKEEDIRRWVTELVDRMSEQHVILKGLFTGKQTNFIYRKWIKVLRVNEKDNEFERQTKLDKLTYKYI